MRCSLSIDNPALADFEKLLRSTIIHLTNCDLSDKQWLQASLPIKMGGLGVRKVSSLALPASTLAASIASLQNTIFDSVRPSDDEMLGVYLSKWQSIPGAVLPSEPFPTKQSFWDSPGITQARQQVEESKSVATQKAQFLAASAPRSGSTSSGLGAPHTCRCGATIDAFGQHSLVCKRAPSRIARHQHLNDLVTRALVSAGVPATKEPVDKRPDEMTQIPWRSGKLLVWM